ncbi:MAG: FkbM family methyltransferase [Pseudomonadota bacterium]
MDGDIRDGDGLDPFSAPFGSFSLSPTLERARNFALRPDLPPLLRRWAYKLFSHFTKKRGIIFDTEFRGTKRRLFVDEFTHDKWLFRKGVHAEEEELDTLDAYRGRPAVFFDLGANNGYFALYAHHVMDKAARIIAVEPHPRTFRKLALHIALNGAENVTAVEAALGPEEGEATMSISGEDGSNTIAPGREANPLGAVTVPMRPLAAIVAEQGVDRIDLVKIDVEGFEDQALLPYFDTTRRELWPREIILETLHRHIWRRDCLAELLERGYEIAKTNDDNAWLKLPA